MIAVADSSPFIGLLKIGEVRTLQGLFQRVVVPPQVIDELKSPKRPPEVQQFAGSLPNWIEVQAPTVVEAIPDLHPGEKAAISLALELRADVLLIDENAGREAAIHRHIRTLRTTALLLEAAKAGVLADLRSAYLRLAATNFRVNRKVLDELLAQFEEFQRQK